MKKKKKLVLGILILLPLIASFLSFLFNINLFGSIILFLLIPSIILSFVQPNSIIKSLIFSSISVPGLLIIDYTSHRIGQWVVPNTVFPSKLFGLVPIEDSIWAFFTCYEILMFYEYFLDRQNKNKYLEKRFLPLIYVSLIVPVLLFLFGFFYPVIFQIKYFYAIWGTVLFLLPTILFFLKYPKLISKLIITGFYFLYFNLCYELTALALGWWYFPRSSNFVGWINIGYLFFPLEEFVFWIILFAMGLLAWYEYFDDDRK